MEQVQSMEGPVLEDKKIEDKKWSKFLREREREKGILAGLYP